MQMLWKSLLQGCENRRMYSTFICTTKAPGFEPITAWKKVENNMNFHPFLSFFSGKIQVLFKGFQPQIAHSQLYE